MCKALASRQRQGRSHPRKVELWQTSWWETLGLWVWEMVPSNKQADGAVTTVEGDGGLMDVVMSGSRGM